MADKTNEPDLPIDDTYDAALDALAQAVVRVWSCCEASNQPSVSGIGSGRNLPEALSVALGMAAVALDLDLDDTGQPYPDDVARDAASASLVRHRPGSWEAQHVTALVFPPESIRDH
jgi:hypothetical protein